MNSNICVSHKSPQAFFLLLLLLPIVGVAQSSYTFLNTPSSARLAALGGVNVSLAGYDVNLFTSNPTLTADSLNGFASASYQFYLADVGQTNISYQHRFKKTGTLAFNVQHVAYGNIKSYDASGAELGEFSSGETALTVGKYFQSNAFRFGANVKTIFSSLAGYNAVAMALDVGGLFVHPEKDLTIGLIVKNLGLTLSNYSSTSSSPLPFDVQVGITFKPEHMPFRFSLTAFNLTDFTATSEQENSDQGNIDKIMRHLNLGAELLVSKNAAILFGYNFQKHQELRLEQLNGGAGLSFGLAIHIKTIELIVSRSSYGPQQAAYGFTLSTNVNKLVRKRETI